MMRRCYLPPHSPQIPGLLLLVPPIPSPSQLRFPHRTRNSMAAARPGFRHYGDPQIPTARQLHGAVTPHAATPDFLTSGHHQHPNWLSLGLVQWPHRPLQRSSNTALRQRSTTMLRTDRSGFANTVTETELVCRAGVASRWTTRSSPVSPADRLRVRKAPTRYPAVAPLKHHRPLPAIGGI